MTSQAELQELPEECDEDDGFDGNDSDDDNPGDSGNAKGVTGVVKNGVLLRLFAGSPSSSTRIGNINRNYRRILKFLYILS